MLTLQGATLLSAEASRAEIGLEHGFRLTLFFLDECLARLLITAPQGLRMPRTWSLSPELAGCDPLDGRDRMDLTGFPGVSFKIAETAERLILETALLRIEVRRSPL